MAAVTSVASQQLETEPGKGINLVGTYSFRYGKENVRFKKLLKLVRTLCL